MCRIGSQILLLLFSIALFFHKQTAPDYSSQIQSQSYNSDCLEEGFLFSTGRAEFSGLLDSDQFGV